MNAPLRDDQSFSLHWDTGASILPGKEGGFFKGGKRDLAAFLCKEENQFKAIIGFSMYNRLQFKRNRKKKIAYDPLMGAQERSGFFWGMNSKRTIADETPNEFLSRFRGSSLSSKDFRFLLIILGVFGFIVVVRLFAQFGWPKDFGMALMMIVFAGFFITAVVSFIRLMTR